MHDIDRGANPTAVRLAALAALRRAQEVGDGWIEGERPGHGPVGASAARGRMPRPSADDAPDQAPIVPPRLGAEGASGVFSAVEKAIRKSRAEFLARLTVYREKLDCETFGKSGAAEGELPWDDAQFVAHRISGVGRTLGFSDLGDAARQTEAAIAAFKRERTGARREAAIARVCGLAGLIEEICASGENCNA